jgi:hypothetical protein
MTIIVQSNPQLVVVPSNNGLPGPPGPTGSGSTIGVKEEGTSLGTDITTLNFTGDGVTATKVGTQVNVAVPGAEGGVAGIIDASTYGFVEGLASGAHAAANATAWAALKADLIAQAVNSDGTNVRGLPQVQLPLGTYEFSAPLDLNFGAVIISGHGSGASGFGAQTRLKFYNSTGIRIQDTNTSGATTKDGTSHFAGTESMIRDLAIEGNYAGGTASEAEYYGVHARAVFYLHNVHVSFFHGDGIRIDADAAGAMGGNANCWRIIGGRSWGNRNGLAVGIGANDDTNGGTAMGLRCDLNRQAGIYDNSLLGNTYVGCEMSSNSLLSNDGSAGLPATCVSYGGNLYQVIVGQDAGASTNAPSGTTADNTWWWYRQPGAPGPGGPLWVSGIHVRAGGAAIVATPGSYVLFSNCYAEWDQPKMQGLNAVVIGGALSAWVRQGKTGTDGVTVMAAGNGGAAHFAPSLEVQSGAALIQMGATGNINTPGSEILLYASQPTYRPNGFAFQLFGASAVTAAMDGSPVFYMIGAANSALAFGRAVLPTTGVWVANLFVGNGREVGGGITAAPASGPHAAGDFFFDASATSGKLGFMCRGYGVPGTFETYYCMTAAKSTGWAAATGTATRTTYDTTTVTTAQLAERVKALIDDLTTRGVIGA